MTILISDVGEEGTLEKYLFPLLLKSIIALSDIDGVSMNPQKENLYKGFKMYC